MADAVKDNQIVAPSANNADAGANGPAVQAASFGGNDRGSSRRRFSTDRVNEDKQFDERTLNIDRVARVVKGGRRFRFRALVVVGDHKGKVGIGIAKGADVSSAVSKATEVAKKRLVSINLYKATLPHEAEAKVGGAHVLVKPAREGTGLVSGGTIRSILEVVGVSSATSKSLGSNNKVNIAYATVKALSSLEPASEWITKKTASKPSKATNKRTK